MSEGNFKASGSSSSRSGGGGSGKGIIPNGNRTVSSSSGGTTNPIALVQKKSQNSILVNMCQVRLTSSTTSLFPLSLGLRELIVVVVFILFYGRIEGESYYQSY